MSKKVLFQRPDTVGTGEVEWIAEGRDEEGQDKVWIGKVRKEWIAL